MGGGGACERHHWSLRSTKCQRCVRKLVAETGVNSTIGAFGGAPYGVLKTVRDVDVPKCVAGTDANGTIGAVRGATYAWGHETCEGCADTCRRDARERHHWC
eukprot:2814819-Pyramimonas_sp.AAC.1